MSGQDHDGTRVMLFLSLLVTAGLIFGAGVMVGVRMAEPADRPPPPADAGKETGLLANKPELVFPEILESNKPLEKLAPAPRPDAGASEPRRAPPPPSAESRPSPAANAGAGAGAAEPAGKNAAAPYTLQVAAYREIEPAGRLAEKLRGLGYQPVEVLRSELGSKGVYFRVRLGRFADAAEAEKTRQELMQKHALDALIVRWE